MGNPRQPIELIEAKGWSHKTKAEAEQRRSGQVKAKKPKSARPPKWLPEEMAKDFRAIGKQLIALGVYSALDADTLGRYLVASHQWLIATQMAEAALTKRTVRADGSPGKLTPDLDEADAWGRIQERYFKQARNCANDLGLTITSRCRLVIPEGARQTPESNPVLELLKRKEARASNG